MAKISQTGFCNVFYPLWTPSISNCLEVKLWAYLCKLKLFEEIGTILLSFLKRKIFGIKSLFNNFIPIDPRSCPMVTILFASQWMLDIISFPTTNPCSNRFQMIVQWLWLSWLLYNGINFDHWICALNPKLHQTWTVEDFDTLSYCYTLCIICAFHSLDQ